MTVVEVDIAGGWRSASSRVLRCTARLSHACVAAGMLRFDFMQPVGSTGCYGMERLRYRKHRGNTVTIDEAREKVRELKVLVELLHSEALCHPEDCEAQDAWHASCRDLNLASAALAELLGDRETAAWLRSKALT